MCTLRVLGVFVLSLIAFSAQPSSTEYMPVDAVRPGMTGVGKTVFEGSRVDEFKVVVLGVLKNLVGPRRTIILARLEGGPLGRSGVIAGMSGSPVYVDGKLVGAIAYSLGSFSTETIAGITPFAEMMAEADSTSRRPGGRPLATPVPVSREDVLGIVRQALPRLQPVAARQEDLQRLGQALPHDIDQTGGLQLRPIDTPLVLSGFSDEARGELADLFRPGGFVTVDGTGGRDGVSAQKPASPAAGLRPGDSVGVDLIAGDLSLGATGTVTEVAGNRVYALGHSLYNLGPTQFPMSRAFIHALLPSLQSPTKVATTGEVVGTVRQDRTTGIAGTLDGGPPMIPLSLVVTRSGGSPKTFKVGLARDELLTPLLAYTAVANILESYERSQGASTLFLTGSATVRAHEPVRYDDVYVGDSPSVAASAAVAAPLLTLLGNEFARAEIDALDLRVRVSEQHESTTLQRVWLDTDRPRAGRTCLLKIVLRNFRGQEETRSLPIEIPARASGSLTLLVADGTHLAQWEQANMRTPQPTTLDQMLRTVNRTRRGNRLYVRLIGGAPGALVNGEQLPALPPSVLAIYEADRDGGAYALLRSALLGEWEIAADAAILGSRQLTISVDPER